MLSRRPIAGDEDAISVLLEAAEPGDREGAGCRDSLAGRLSAPASG